MLLTDAFCYAVILISATASCFEEELQPKEITTKQLEKRVVKREAAVIIDNFPLSNIDFNKPNVIYKRISKQRYRYPHKPSIQSLPPRAKYGIPKGTRKPYKKYKVKKVNPKYAVPTKKSSPKPKYERSSKPPIAIPDFGSRKRRPQRLQQPQHSQSGYYETRPDKNLLGFGEPPAVRPEPNYNVLGMNIPDEDTPGPEPYENRLAFSNKINSFIKPEFNLGQHGSIFDEDQELDTYADVFKYSEAKPQVYNKVHAKKKPDFVGDIRKIINRPWKAPAEKVESQVLVGGQYAEPPARYVAKPKPNHEMYFEDEDSVGSETRIYSPEPTISVSPYVNYKNGNMAFSPQNLNDAFSIVDK